VPSIRGHLRFWWRATRGAVCDSVEKLREREVEIWGDTENPSPVVVEVTAQPGSSTQRQPDDYGFQRFGPEAYALFSAKQNKAVLTKEGFEFVIKVCWPKLPKLQEMRKREELLDAKIDDIGPDIESAIWAWLNFGGLGARTRRGCGAVHISKASAPLLDVSWQGSGLRVFEGNATHDALSAWAKSVCVYREFRQKQRGIKQRQNSNVPEGRSHWPEPDTIRELTGCAVLRHQDPVVGNAHIGAFPRAVLGLPIIFWFKDGPGKDNQKRPNPPSKDKDPCDAELVPEVWNEKGERKLGTRMASPVVTRPIFSNGKWKPAIIVLPSPHLSELTAILKVKGVKSGQTVIEHRIDSQRIVDQSLEKLSPMRGKASALEAFLAFAQEHGFKEVKA